MKREGTIGAATFLAIAAVVGVSLQTGPKQAETGRMGQSAEAKRSKASIVKNDAHHIRTGCSGVQEELEDFLTIDDLPVPGECYDPDQSHPEKLPDALLKQTAGLKFVIALLPDPVHTHASSNFDQFAIAIQEGAQDEKYDFDSSWLPWDDQESPHALLADEKLANREKAFEESQPGIILFRKTALCSKQPADCKKEESESYSEGLIVFVVGEEATHGIHKEQFQNALEWIAWLQSGDHGQVKNLAILGPTFSGSFPSLTQVLIDRRTAKHLDLAQLTDGRRLVIYSGSASSGDAALSFQNTFDGQVVFHSFVQSDEEILGRFCKYLGAEQPGFDPGRIAIISEDETAYGGAVSTPKAEEVDKADENDKPAKLVCREKALKLYYPRDISALRGAYQTKSLFDVGTSSQTADAQKRNLPTDLADPTGKVHDSIRTYAGNQTPLSQEASLMEIVAALRELQARYIILRSSTTLDQLFLSNFLRRSYPDGRIVILGSDLMFIRERGSTGLSGAMTLSTYPLFPLERDWTEHQSFPAADRTFSSDTAEGTYVALRLLLNDGSQNLKDRSWNDGSQDLNDQNDHISNPERVYSECHVLEYPNKKAIFVPPVYCTQDPDTRDYSPIPDYSPPFWTLSNQCGEMGSPNAANIANTGKRCPYPGPATWLSVIGVNRFWPLASLTNETPKAPPVDPRLPTQRADDRKDDAGGRPGMPLGMKVFLFTLALFSVFHAWCCWSGSYTAKPVFRAHFASTGEKHHNWLVFGGSCCVAFIAIVAGWGSGVFSIPATGLAYPWCALCWVAFAWLMAWGSVLAYSRTSRELAKDVAKEPPSSPTSSTMTDNDSKPWNYLLSSVLFVVATGLFFLFFIVPLQWKLLTENRVLTYWRAMHLTSGVSPLVPIFLFLIGLYLSFWFTLHGLALFGLDQPCLPERARLAFEDKKRNKKYLLTMFSQEGVAVPIVQAAMPFSLKVFALVALLSLLFVAAAFGMAGGVPIRSLSSHSYSIIFLLGLSFCCSLSIVEACRLYHLWDELKRLLTFLDRLPLRRTLAALRGFSWGSVWKMSGNVLEVRYKVISRQMECMNHTIATLQEFLETSDDRGSRNSLAALLRMRRAGMKFADWYSANYLKSRVGDLTRFTEFQKSVAAACGTLLTQVLVPAWRKEEESLLISTAKDEKEETSPKPPPAEDSHIRNAEEFVCLNYLGFIQNVLGRLRTMAMVIIALFVASACAMSSYPFDPRQALSAVLVVLFVIGGVVIVKVYADMHRDATLSHVTNTKPGELGAEFWFKIIGFGFAPLIGLTTRIFPGITDFIFAWLQPGISSLK